MSGAVSLRFNTQAQTDIQRMMRQLTDLQRQVASGAKSNDLAGFGGGASRLLNAQSLRASADAHASSANQLVARFGVQAQALDQVATATQGMAKAIRDAISSDDGRAVAVEMNLNFSSIVSALNETWNGQPLFAGQRTDNSGPVKISSLNELLAATGPDDIYDESEQPQTFTLSGGAVVQLADKASTLSQDLFNVFRSLKTLVDGAGGQLGAPMTGAERDQLQAIAVQLEGAADTFVNAEGRAGQLEKRFTAEFTRLQDRSNLLLREIGDQADADLAQVSIEISTLLAQYEAAAKTFTDISKLSLLNYL